MEPIEAAVETGCPLIPVYAANGSSTDGTVVRVGEPLPRNGASSTETRQALRDAIERLMHDHQPGTHN